MKKISDEVLIQDLERVAKKLNKLPTVKEYNIHGSHHSRTYYGRFGDWNGALQAADLPRRSAHGASDETILTHIRKKSADREMAPIREFLNNNTKFGIGTYQKRFGGDWETIARAGRKPPKNAPVSESNYDLYIQTAINANYPTASLFGLLRAFTGIPIKPLMKFRSDWVSRLGSDLQDTLITVPSEHISSNNNWVLIAPTHYTVADKKKPTRLESLLRWLKNSDTDILSSPRAKGGIKDRIINEAGLDVELSDLRASVAAHLARRGVSRGEIEMQVGFEKTNWQRSIEDYFLYLYQFEDYCHPDYEPSGTYIDPNTGEPQRIESNAN